jgi:hypothetical protein
MFKLISSRESSGKIVKEIAFKNDHLTIVFEGNEGIGFYTVDNYRDGNNFAEMKVQTITNLHHLRNIGAIDEKEYSKRLKKEQQKVQDRRDRELYERLKKKFEGTNA